MSASPSSDFLVKMTTLLNIITVVLFLHLLTKSQGRFDLTDDETYRSACAVVDNHQSLNNITSFHVESTIECLSRCNLDYQCQSASVERSNSQSMVCRTFSESGIEELCCVEYNNTGLCHHYMKEETYNVLLGTIGTTTSPLCTYSTYQSATDCHWYKSRGIVMCSGLYNISVEGTVHTVQCDMETDGGGWTIVFSRNADYSFNGDKTWKEYKDGFGIVTENYWLGNGIIHQLTNNRSSTLYVQLTNQVGNVSWARYDGFTIASESDMYRLDFNVSSYEGTAGDGLHVYGIFASWNSHGMGFTTKDNDNDGTGGANCAQSHGGWWWNSCGSVYITAPSFYWATPSFGPLKLAVMMIRQS